MWTLTVIMKTDSPDHHTVCMLHCIYCQVNFYLNLYIISLDGWNYDTGYKFHVTHLPNTGVIRLKLYEGSTLLHDTGDIIDNGADALRGGRLGVYCDSQENILWSALSYR